MKLFAPAKLNLCLRIAGKRPDGYHRVDSVMVAVGLYDEIRIARSGRQGELKVDCDHPDVPGGEKNIVFQAARLLLEENGIDEGIRITIRKKIPVGAGLGGGSSDAAATLRGLDRLFRLKLSRRQLAGLASRLGADVPFFLAGRPARARGKGERLTPIRRFPTMWFVILYPGFPVSTSWAYRRFDKLTKSVGNTSITAYLKKKNWMGLLRNDLEIATVARYPKLALLKKRLIDEGANGALMSGSGSSVFGIFPTAEAARSAYRRLRKEEGAVALLARSLN
jgi:4-diphosphocytidyl-2-C-methyl-D-erythritol kinase